MNMNDDGVNLFVLIAVKRKIKKGKKREIQNVALEKEIGASSGPDKT